MIATFKNTLLFSGAGILPAPSCICVSVDAFIIRRAAFPSMPKTAKPYTDLTFVLVQFVSLCVICRIYSHFMHLCSIYSGRSASCPAACVHPAHWLRPAPQKQKARDPFVSRLAPKESRVSLCLYAPEKGPPAAFHARHSSSFCALGSFLSAASRRRALRLSAQRST